ncbi:hypothetical protein J1N35_017515 [Gossypium stocksii]|uniref:Uncharacterized protein n=1 Tax=Gossypium stocksii TaxID=47602 RepID=A0A9D3VP68_9ROSI|nr:hypothetical protein J1N35_017515 [Gossypium stocksii]
MEAGWEKPPERWHQLNSDGAAVAGGVIRPRLSGTLGAGVHQKHWGVLCPGTTALGCV